jgi:4-amino-4-deoxy-L-arabinose transferase-like glycosyltransferase
VRWGLPYDFHPDEHTIVDPALRMWDTGDLNPHFWYYPALYIYVQSAVLGPVRILARALADLSALEMQGLLYFAGRSVTALFGTGTALLAYLAGRRLWGPVAGLGAAGILALSFLDAQNAQFIATDVPAGFFTALCLLLALRGAAPWPEGPGPDDREGGSRYWFLASGAVAGLAAATKFNAGLCGVATVAVWALSRRRPRDLVSWVPVVAGLAALATFVLANPYFVLAPEAIEGLQHEWAHYHGGHHGFEGDRNWLYYPLYLWRSGFGPGLALLVAAGALLLVRHRWRLLVALLTFPALYYYLLSTVRVRFERNLLPVTAYLALLGGYGLYRLVLWTSRRSRTMRTIVAVLVALLAVAWPLWRIARYDQIIVQPDTRALAIAWIEENVAPGARFCVERYAPPLPEGRYSKLEKWSLCAGGLEDIAADTCQFAIASSRMYGRYTRNREAYPEMAQCYDFIFERWPAIREFTGHEVAEHDPVIRVLYVPR